MRKVTSAEKLHGNQKEGPKGSFQNRDPRLGNMLPNSKILRSIEDAWEIVLKHKELADSIVRFIHLNRHIPFDDARQYAFLSMFETALVWDPERRLYENFALDRCRKIWRVIENEQPIRLHHRLLQRINDYRKFMRINPGATIDDYMNKHAISRKCATSLEILAARRLSARFISIHDNTKSSRDSDSPYSLAGHILDKLCVEGGCPGQFPTPYGELAEKELTILIRLAVFTSKYRKNLERIYGMNGHEETFRNVIAKEEGVAPQAVSEKMRRQLARLSKLDAIRELANYDPI